MTNLKPILTTLVLVALCLPLRSGLAETIVFENPENVPIYVTRLANTIYQEAFSRLGLEYTTRTLPSNRGIFLATIGKVDGLVHRSEAFHRHYPNLVQVDESIVTINIAVYAMRPTIQINNWSDLAKGEFRTNYLHSVQFVAEKIKQHLPEQQSEGVNSRISGLRKLLGGHADFYVGISEIVDLLLAGQFSARGIVKIGTLDQLLLYPSLAEHQAALAPRLAETLRQMKRDGTIQRLREAALQP